MQNTADTFAEKEQFLAIYKEITQLIEKSVDDIDTSSSPDLMDASSKKNNSDAINLLNEYKNKLISNIHELQELSEWDVFTIATYGETNAGKSTLIEALRIYLGEETKKLTEENFQKIAKDIKFDPIEFESLKVEIEKQEELVKKSTEDFILLRQALTKIEQDIAIDVKALTEKVIIEKQSFIGWKKIIYFFKKTIAEKQLMEVKNSLTSITKDHENTLTLAQNKIKFKSNLIDKNKSDKKSIEEKLYLLKEYQDGIIIGNGDQDFTRQNHTYQFNFGDQKFSLIDVPGIEGNESLVHTAINNAVKTAHAVFYITSKATPPNTGDNGKQGTLEKIKSHLNDHTEVWTVFNKPINSPTHRAFKGDGFLTEDEFKSLKDLDEKLAENLGSAYQGHHSLSALPAFYAVAKCLYPLDESPDEPSRSKNRDKFLKVNSADSLLKKSQFLSFTNFLTKDLCKNYKSKIIESNKNKIKSTLCNGSNLLQNLSDKFKHTHTTLKKQFISTKNQLELSGDNFIQSFRSSSSDIVESHKSNLRNSLYEIIESDVSNDVFKSELKDFIDRISSPLTKNLHEIAEKCSKTLAQDLKNIVEKFQKNSSEILNININNNFSLGLNGMNLNFKINNGIEVVGLLSSIGGAVGLVLAAGGPAGWGVAAVIGAVSLLIGFVKSILGFFSSDYKKAQQKKSANENIRAVFSQIENKINDILSEINEKLQIKMSEIVDQLAAPLNSLENITESLKIAKKDINIIVKKLT